MKKEIKTVIYDEELKIEAYRFEGIMQPFPNHFHDYYVIGFVESGKRHLLCKNEEYTLEPNTMILFHPGDNHACVQCDNGTLDYRALNISQNVMLDLMEEITGKREFIGFSQNVVTDEESSCYFRLLHQMIMEESTEFEKEENLLLLISSLVQKFGQPFEMCIPECQKEIEEVCSFMEQNYEKHISLEEICQKAGLSKSTLLRTFTKLKGITPYRYLETIRINEAKKLLEKGITPLEAALQTGFSDQSHFTHYFNQFIGLAPGVYRDIFKKESEVRENEHEK